MVAIFNDGISINITYVEFAFIIQFPITAGYNKRCGNLRNGEDRTELIQYACLLWSPSTHVGNGNNRKVPGRRGLVVPTSVISIVNRINAS